MSRSNQKTGKDPQPKPPADPLLVDADLKLWAGERIAGQGRKAALLGRVELLVLALNGRSIEARVRGNRRLPYRTYISIDDGGLNCNCTCDQEDRLACKHAVAVLEALRFPLPKLADPAGQLGQRRRTTNRRGRGRGRIIQQAPHAPGFVILGKAERNRTREERLLIARKEELSTRRQRARREKAGVHPLAAEGLPPRFEVGAELPEGAQTVTLRGQKGQHAVCTCADFASNELESCKHIERVRLWYLRKKKRFPLEIISAWWRPREWMDVVPEVLREIRVEVPPPGLSDTLARYFEPEGWLRQAPAGQTPSAWARTALSAARAEALERGLTWDLDPLVEPRLLAAEEEEARLERLGAIDGTSVEWLEIKQRLGLTLHPYQEVGTLLLARAGRAFLADDMGLGKTVQAVAASLLLQRVAGVKRTLVVCPASLKHQWRREIEKICGESAMVVEGERSLRLKAYRDWQAGFLILNYELVLRDLEAIRRARVDIVILDEAQRIKNWDTKTARAVKQLKSPHAFVLTGTPLENRLLELHSLVEFLHPRALGPRWRQFPYHAVTEKQGRVIAYEALDVLRSRLSGFFLRRERHAVLDQLPERTDNTFWTDLSPVQREPYKRLLYKLVSLLSRDGPLAANEVRILLQTLTAMRILCNAYGQYRWEDFKGRVASKRQPTPAELKGLHSPKLEEFARVLEDVLDESSAKIVVFSQWHRMLHLAHFMVRERLDSRDLRAQIFHGGLNSASRGEMIEAFHNDPEFRVLFSTDAGGLGLNLQDAASIVVNLEVPWNPAVIEQRVGRVHRMGQRRGVHVLHFVTRGAIEERVRQVVESKRALFDGLFVNGAEQVSFEGMDGATFMEKVRVLVND